MQGHARLRAHQVCLRLLHLSMDFVTESFVKSGNSGAFIDESSWPITIKELVDDLNSVAGTLTHVCMSCPRRMTVARDAQCSLVFVCVSGDEGPCRPSSAVARCAADVS